jgi:hypothetical protein
MSVSHVYAVAFPPRGQKLWGLVAFALAAPSVLCVGMALSM